MYHGIRTVGLLTLLGLFGACGGGGGGGGAPVVAQMPPPTNASPGGIWNGTDSASSLAVVGIITEAGQLYLIRSDGAQFTGTASVSGTTVSGDLLGFAPFGATFADGSNHGTGTLSGTVTERSTLNLVIVFTTSAGTATTSTLPMSFNATYNNASSLATIAGTFTAVDGTVVTVSAGGSVTGQNAANGCVINGLISVINPSYNAYGVSYSFASCTGQYAVLNGVTETGLGTLNTVALPVQATIGVSATVGTQMVALVEVLDRTSGATPPQYLTGYCGGSVSPGAPMECGFVQDTTQCPVGVAPIKPVYVVGCMPPSSMLLDQSRTCSAKNSRGQKIIGNCEVAQ
jgi:hypothetical protein